MPVSPKAGDPALWEWRKLRSKIVSDSVRAVKTINRIMSQRGTWGGVGVTVANNNNQVLLGAYYVLVVIRSALFMPTEIQRSSFTVNIHICGWRNWCEKIKFSKVKWPLMNSKQALNLCVTFLPEARWGGLCWSSDVWAELQILRRSQPSSLEEKTGRTAGAKVLRPEWGWHFWRNRKPLWLGCSE